MMKKGTSLHRNLGRAWIVAMLVTATSSFWITTPYNLMFLNWWFLAHSIHCKIARFQSDIDRSNDGNKLVSRPYAQGQKRDP